MSTEQTWRTKSSNLEETLRLGEFVGSKLRGGEVIELVSDLGGGKTSFVKGIAKGAGSKDTVRSPSFTLSNEYQANDLRIYHFDFYRLNEAGIMRDELAELLSDELAVIIVEWGGVVDDVLPNQKLIIDIQSVGENEREFMFRYPEELGHLTKKENS